MGSYSNAGGLGGVFGFADAVGAVDVVRQAHVADAGDGEYAVMGWRSRGRQPVSSSISRRMTSMGSSSGSVQPAGTSQPQMLVMNLCRSCARGRSGRRRRWWTGGGTKHVVLEASPARDLEVVQPQFQPFAGVDLAPAMGLPLHGSPASRARWRDRAAAYAPGWRMLGPASLPQPRRRAARGCRIREGQRNEASPWHASGCHVWRLGSRARRWVRPTPARTTATPTSTRTVTGSPKPSPPKTTATTGMR